MTPDENFDSDHSASPLEMVKRLFAVAELLAKATVSPVDASAPGCDLQKTQDQELGISSIHPQDCKVGNSTWDS